MIKLYQLIFMLYCFLWLGSIAGLAQQRTITGKITDEQNVVIPGVSIVVKGTDIGTITNESGGFSLKLPSNAQVLLISAIGYVSIETLLDDRSQYDIKLAANIQQLGEVVVIGYGTVNKNDVTTSIASINQKDVSTLPVAGIDQAMQGRLAGVTISNNGGQPGGGVSVRVRGLTSVNGNEPLYVVDGVQLNSAINTSSNQQFLGGGAGQTAQSAIANINPNDIESIDVLKDAAAQAIYGSRAANGVVIITTKKGKAGEGKISYDTYFGQQFIPKKLDVMNLQQFATFQNSIIPEINAVTGGNQLPIPEFADPSVLGNGTDWQDEIYQRGTIQNHQLAFSGGQDKTTYFFSLGYFKQLGTLIETNFERYSVRMNLENQVKEWLKAGVTLNLNRSNQKIGLSDGFDAVTSTVLYNSPASPVRDVNGSYLGQTTIGTAQFGNPFNPVALARFRDIRAVNSNAFGSLYAELTILKGLTYRTELNYNFNLTNDKAYQPLVRNEEQDINIIAPSQLREQRTNSLYWAVKNYVNYNKTFAEKHNIYVTVGHEVQSSKYDYVVASRQNLILNLPSLNAGAGGNDSNEQIGAGANIWKIESMFARVNYTFSNKYALSATIRRDGSSNFGPNSRYGTFKGISGSWTISNEEFMKNLTSISYLKLRVGYGEVGNQDVNRPNSYTANVNLIPITPFGPGSLPDNIANPDLSWETVKTFNAGIDGGLLQDRIEFSIDVYQKISTNMLLASQLPIYSGLGVDFGDIRTPIVNGGQMTNKGIDISITSFNMRNDNFTWKTNFIFSHYKNTLDALNTPTAVLRGDFNEYDGSPKLVSLSSAGQPLGSFYGYVTDGLFTSMEQLNDGTNWGLDVKPDGQWLGDIRFKDLNGDGVIDDKDVTRIGNPNPKFTMGLTNTFNYKGFELSVFLYASYGADIFNYSRRQTEGLRNSFNNQLTTVLDRYTESNPNATIPRYNQWHENNVRISDRYVEDGSYLRIQNVQLGYNLPENIIKKIKMKNARVYIAAQNLYTFTKYSGYDPELGAINSNPTFMNIDNGRYPIPRTFTVGASIEF
jgi:TonB-dependent starch-binding outer membrane protein SusC